VTIIGRIQAGLVRRAIQRRHEGVTPMSQIQLSPYINFQGQARAAMEFYQQVLGGILDLQPANDPGARIQHARLEAEGIRIIAVDGHPAYPAQVGENMALALTGTDHDRITRIFHALAEGGTIKLPLTAQPGGVAVGWLTDRFGINWMVQIDPA
jgi:PhnB protein